MEYKIAKNFFNHQKYRLNEEITNNKGYSTEIKINKKELDVMRQYIESQYFKTIKNHNPKVAEEISSKQLSMNEYHLVSRSLDHSKMWGKISRILPSAFFDWITNTYFYKNLKEVFGEFIISDEENLGWPNLYWRIVRPSCSEDIGPLHRDSWFWELNSTYKKPNFAFKRIKVWIPIYTVKGENGLLVEPFSQKRNDILWTGEDRHGIQKPKLITDENCFSTKLLELEPGDSVLFNDNLIHGGSSNNSKYTRVSMEFTMLVKI